MKRSKECPGDPEPMMDCDCIHMTGRNEDLAQICCHSKETGLCVHTSYGASLNCSYYKKLKVENKEKQIFQIIGLLNDLVSLSTIYSEEDVYNEVQRADLNLDVLKNKLHRVTENLHRGK